MSQNIRRAVIRMLRAGAADREVCKSLGVPLYLPRMLRNHMQMPANRPRNRPWAEDDFVLLREHYAKPRRERPRLVTLAQKLRRPIAGVKMMAVKLRKAGSLVEGQ